MRRAKIVCTLGPATFERDAIRGLIEAGMDVARLNFSHGDHDSHRRLIGLLRELSAEVGRNVAILLDLAGPKIRLGELSAPAHLGAGELWRFTTRETVGAGNLLPVRYPHFCDEVRVGDRIFLADGLVQLLAEEVGGDEVSARVLNGGVVTSRKGVNLPGGGDRLPALTAKDADDLAFGLECGVDWVSMSFVRRAEDAGIARAVMARVGRVVPLIAKIEKIQALERLESIIAAFDGLMVARGDLGVEVELESLPAIQKKIISAANHAAKPVITATQMLLSMVDNPRPTRAEVTDVANAILDGTDAVMLSEESAVGKYPVEAVRTMARIAERTSSVTIREEDGFCKEWKKLEPVSQAIAHSTKLVADEVHARLIITPTATGETARIISSLRPSQPILALSANPEVVRRLALTWGVRAVLVTPADSTDQLFDICHSSAQGLGLTSPGDRAVVTAGVPLFVAGGTNLLRVITL